MLITRLPIDEASMTGGGIENVTIITYERDSIWELRSDSVPLNRESLNLQERKIRWKNSRYRYQEVSKQEALRLLKNPLGSIPISRTQPPIRTSRGEIVEALIKDLSERR
jgi:hypothetical protein